MYGAIERGSYLGIPSQLLKRALAETAAKGDLVNVESSLLSVTDAGEVIAGVAREAGVVTDVIEFNATPGLVIIMDNDNDTTTFASTHEYTNFDMIGATGAMQIDTNTTTTSSAQLKCLKYNPQGVGFDSDTSIGLFAIHEVQVVV